MGFLFKGSKLHKCYIKYLAIRVTCNFWCSKHVRTESGKPGPTLKWDMKTDCISWNNEIVFGEKVFHLIVFHFGVYRTIPRVCIFLQDKLSKRYRHEAYNYKSDIHKSVLRANLSIGGASRNAGQKIFVVAWRRDVGCAEVKWAGLWCRSSI